MKLNRLEKSRGVLLFAFNSENVNYVSIADANAKLITKNLNLPITLVTDHNAKPKFNYQNVIFKNLTSNNVRLTKNNDLIEWKNLDRFSAYELSPYQETILLDVDYLILDSSLLKLFDQEYHYKLQYKMTTPFGINTDEMGPMSLPMVWATVILFKKTKESKNLFTMVKRIQNNYDYYRALFSIRDTNFRNDFAFSIANIILNGYAIDPSISIPWPMLTIENNIIDLIKKENFTIVRYHDKSDIVATQNIHIMDKIFLQSKQFYNFVDIQNA